MNESPTYVYQGCFFMHEINIIIVDVIVATFIRT